ncbi:NAD(P)H-binding protein [Salinibacterium soli]|uniref:NAD(P)H-binding protein n=1 Tax=Antiquaquibacter soli TaxID=3064523 RepID=A0ABT9BPN5_9MICO|nr:NAD(P)H-binding protein [Protaetiibacter sp. WY-16]MDO7882398.1 NAD(P)H-binding protein [Protaetiibacter sp. WY-16]
MTTYLITGSTGRLGSAALGALVQRVGRDAVTALVRGAGHPAADVRRVTGDYDDPRSLRQALDGIDRVLFVSSPQLDPAIRSRQHLAVVGAARDAGVEHLVYTSARGAQHDPAHRATESALDGMSATVLRNTLYTEPWIEAALDAGVVRSAAAGALISTASIADLGEAAARALVAPPQARVLELRGPAWGFAQLAAVLGSPLEEVSDEQTGPFAVLFPLVRAEVLAESGADLAALLDRQPEDIAAVAARLTDARSR